MSKLTFDAQQWKRAGTPYANIHHANELADLIMGQAQEQCKKTGSHPTVLLFLTEDTVHLVNVPLSNKEEERTAVGNLALHLFARFGAFASGLASECWFFPGVTTVPEDPAKLLLLDNKLEFLFVQVTWDGEPPVARIMEIVRMPGKSVSLRTREDLITAEGIDGVLLLKKEAQSVGEGLLRRPILV